REGARRPPRRGHRCRHRPPLLAGEIPRRRRRRRRSLLRPFGLPHHEPAARRARRLRSYLAPPLLPAAGAPLVPGALRDARRLPRVHGRRRRRNLVARRRTRGRRFRLHVRLQLGEGRGSPASDRARPAVDAERRGAVLLPLAAGPPPAAAAPPPSPRAGRRDGGGCARVVGAASAALAPLRLEPVLLLHLDVGGYAPRRRALGDLAPV